MATLSVLDEGPGALEGGVRINKRDQFARPAFQAGPAGPSSSSRVILAVKKMRGTSVGPLLPLAEMV